MAEFRVVIDGLDLDTKTNRRINDAIQKVVLAELADLDLTTRGQERAVVAFRPHPDWWGFYAKILKHAEIRRIDSVDEAFRGLETGP